REIVQLPDVQTVGHSKLIFRRVWGLRVLTLIGSQPYLVFGGLISFLGVRFGNASPRCLWRWITFDGFARLGALSRRNFLTKNRVGSWKLLGMDRLRPWSGDRRWNNRESSPDFLTLETRSHTYAQRKYLPGTQSHCSGLPVANATFQMSACRQISRTSTICL